ncbi:hypothetical protein M231_03641 [Tremella mesenterica]|uniref:Uncharacterized protein n=1 Tax=Tremella mesenterica TaxID=5217 RepID=A0A4Q1BMU1_TREME|nr:hypothetical protein M231_03641 [Tremella mesenterica]
MVLVDYLSRPLQDLLTYDVLFLISRHGPNPGSPAADSGRGSKLHRQSVDVINSYLWELDYLSCEKSKTSTTVLVGAGIGVTLGIFALIFGIVWISKRNRKRSTRDTEVGKKVSQGDGNTKKGTNSKAEEEEEEEYETEEEEDVPNENIKKKAVTVEEDHSDEEAWSPQPPPEKTLPSRSSRPSQVPPLQRPPLVRENATEGSPIEPVPTRQLYPSNPSPQPRHLEDPRRLHQGRPIHRPSVASQRGAQPPLTRGSIPDIPPFNPQRNTLRTGESHSQTQTRPSLQQAHSAPARGFPHDGRRPSNAPPPSSAPRRPSAPGPTAGVRREIDGNTRPLDIRKSTVRPLAPPPENVTIRRSVLPSYYEPDAARISRLSTRQSHMLAGAPPLPPPFAADSEGVLGPKSRQSVKGNATVQRPDEEFTEDLHREETAEETQLPAVAQSPPKPTRPKLKATESTPANTSTHSSARDRDTAPSETVESAATRSHETQRSLQRSKGQESEKDGSNQLAPPTSHNAGQRKKNSPKPSPTPSPGAYDGLAPSSAKPTPAPSPAVEKPNTVPPAKTTKKPKPKKPEPVDDDSDGSIGSSGTIDTLLGASSGTDRGKAAPRKPSAAKKAGQGGTRRNVI